MRRLELDYLSNTRRSAWARFVLIAAALGFAADQATYYSALQNDVAAMETRAARRPAAPVSTSIMREVGAEEIAFARETVSRLSTPWQSLFRSVEAGHIGSIALLSIEPDAQSRTLTITGEAKNYLAALSYVASLSEQPALRRVHLVNHETLRGTVHPMGFTISAGWKDRL